MLDKYETTNVWHIDPKFDKIHSAVFPLELCNRVIRYYSYIDDLIFDPFAGSGTVGRAAASLNRQFFLTEKEIRYVNRMKESLTKSVHLLNQDKVEANFVSVQSFINLIEK